MTARWFVLLWTATILIGILAVIYGCATTNDEDTIEECHYEVWHSEFVRICE